MCGTARLGLSRTPAGSSRKPIWRLSLTHLTTYWHTSFVSSTHEGAQPTASVCERENVRKHIALARLKVYHQTCLETGLRVTRCLVKQKRPCYNISSLSYIKVAVVLKCIIWLSRECKRKRAKAKSLHWQTYLLEFTRLSPPTRKISLLLLRNFYIRYYFFRLTSHYKFVNL